MPESQAPAELDATGLYCPEPVMLLHTRIKDIALGGELLVRATDPTTLRDVPNFCHFLGHELVAQSEEGGEFRFLLRRGA